VVYRRRELWLLLLLAATVGVGLAVREFRAGFPELAERLEAVDAEEPPPASGLPPEDPIKVSASPAQTDGRLDLNRATSAELQQLPGIGPTLAQRIVEARERQGGFASPEDLRRVPGIGEKKFEAIRDLVTVSQ
jgi:competence ComEA-like helix-hairpin-helix protein